MPQMPKRSKENSNYTTASSSSSKKNLAIGIAGHNRKPREETETSLIVLAAHALHYDPRTCSSSGHRTTTTATEFLDWHFQLRNVRAAGFAQRGGTPLPPQVGPQSEDGGEPAVCLLCWQLQIPGRTGAAHEELSQFDGQTQVLDMR